MGAGGVLSKGKEIKCDREREKRREEKRERERERERERGIEKERRTG